MPITFTIPGLDGQPFAARPGAVHPVNATGVAIPERSAGPPQGRALSVMGGRLNVIDGALTAPSVGKAVARSDGRTSLALFEAVNATSATAILNGQPVTLDIAAPLQAEGFQDGLHYYLPVGPDDAFVCEPGERHRTWHVTGAASGQTRAQIAAAAGVPERAVTGAWLDARPRYGATPATAVHMEVFLLWAEEVHGSDKPGRSDHLFFECGHDYRGFDPNGRFAAGGEDEMHPLLIAAYGTGTPPVVPPIYTRLAPPFTVWRGVTTSLGEMWWPRYGFAFAMERCTVPRTLQGSETAMMTVRETRMLTPWLDAPKVDNVTVTDPPYTGDVIWAPNGNHTQAIYSSLSDGLGMDGNMAYHAGWAEGYDHRARVEFPMPMTMFSHGHYFQGDCLGGEVRHSLIASNSSCGFQIRSGGLLHGNVLFDNNIQTGVWADDGTREYPIFLDNVGEGMGYRRVAHAEGGVNWGFGVGGPGCAMAGNVLMHGANPDDPEEIGRKTDGWHEGISEGERLYEDTQVWDWGTTRRNVDGLDPAAIAQTTIYRWVGGRIGKTVATKPEVIAYFADCPSIGGAIRDYQAWVKARFGTPIPAGDAPADLVFRPKAWLDGRRWDMRRNWSVERLPGENVADTADLDGHDVHFTWTDARIAALRSRGGRIEATSGRLAIGILRDAATIRTRFAGQVWIDTPAHPVTAVLESGRLVLGAPAADLDLQATGRAQALLGPEATVPAGRALVVAGPRNRVGWDGAGSAVLTIAGRLELRAGVEMIVGGGPTRARRIYQWMGRAVTGSLSGATGRIAAVEKWSNSGDLKVWLTDVVGDFAPGDAFEVYPDRGDDFVRVPTLVTVSGIVGAGLPQLRVFRSGMIGDGLAEPTVAASLVLAAGAQVVIDRRDLLAPGTYDLTGPGVTVTDKGATLPAGVSVTAGTLVLAV